MEKGGQTGVGNFLLLEFVKEQDLQPLLFGLFLSMYLVSLKGNLFIILAIISNSHLHRPMYFFLSNLPLADISFTSNTIQKMLLSIQTQNKVITHAGCLTQIFFFVICCPDSFLLTVMACECFIAIYHPLHYMVIMNPQICLLLVLASWCLTVSVSLLKILPVLKVPFCTNTKIPHFYCDLSEILKLTYSDTHINNILVYFVPTTTGDSPLLGIFFSSSQIVSFILGISSAGGKYKAFSTYGSHLSGGSLFFATGIGICLSSENTPSSWRSLVTSVMYALVSAMLNPFFYRLRNKNMKGALG